MKIKFFTFNKFRRFFISVNLMPLKNFSFATNKSILYLTYLYNRNIFILHRTIKLKVEISLCVVVFLKFKHVSENHSKRRCTLVQMTNRLNWHTACLKYTSTLGRGLQKYYFLNSFSVLPSSWHNIGEKFRNWIKYLVFMKILTVLL